ncbi:MAG TPA: MarR family transcriptional regulator [Nocardioides sp.]|uniref:MarR family winged helix-turn-helix transcriptional regulator n=1 Tax=Nocardioides sp. TaxID=35761 RepID=UPI002E359076|nr:MarR family transcriptional regulator [Nocardioides sp.]HEX5087587.1 MarR family transcriptional regulator [Nocardioides sp.]
MPTTNKDIEELAAAFVTASRALVGIAIRSVEAAPVPVTIPQHRVLVLLAANGPQAIGTLAQQLGVNPSNATRVCDRLQRLDLVRRSRSDSDGRAVHVTITAAGRRLVDAVTEHRRREVAAVLRELSPDQVEAVVEALTAFSRAAHERAEAEWPDASW